MATNNPSAYVPVTGTSSPSGPTAGMVANLGSGLVNANAGGYGLGRGQLDVSQADFDKAILSVIQGDAGLAGLVKGAAPGGAGTIGNFGADFTRRAQSLLSVLTSEQETSDTSKKRMSVICTELNTQGRISNELYASGVGHFAALHPYVVYGYHLFAYPTVRLMRKSDRLCRILTPVCVQRYEYIAGNRRAVLGGLTVWLGEPICFLIGAVRAAYRRNRVWAGA